MQSGYRLPCKDNKPKLQIGRTCSPQKSQKKEKKKKKEKTQKLGGLN